MRHTAVKSLALVADRASTRPASMQFTTLAGDGASCLAALGADVVMLSREIAGLACRIRLGADHFRGVAVVDRDGRCVVRLLHSDLALTLDLATANSFDEAEALADEVAALMRLPTLVMGGTGRFWLPAAEDPLEVVASGRRLSLATPRRPRFLARRRPGRPVFAGKAAGTETVTPA
jgi:hypothetical protein